MGRRQGLLIWIGASAALMLLGAFAPWVKTPLGYSASGVDGHGDGWVVVAAAVIGIGLAAMTYRSRAAGLFPLLCGVAALIVVLIDRGNLHRTLSSQGKAATALVSVSWGLTLSLVASASMAVAGAAWLIGIRTEPDEEDSPDSEQLTAR